MTYEQFTAHLSDASVIDVIVDGKDMGAVLVIGPEIHACVKPEAFGRWFNKRIVRLIDSLIDKYGYASTTVTSGNEVGDAFVKRIGFERVESGEVWKYRKVKNGH